MVILSKMKPKQRKLSRVLIVAAFYLVCENSIAVEDINGNWVLDSDSSDEFDSASKALNKSIKKARRKAESENQKFDNGPRPRQRNRYDSQVRATEAQIKDSSAVKHWGGPDEQDLIFQTSTIKFYVGRKVVALYGSSQKRMLTINPSGRAYSYSGTEVTDDYVGRSLTYIDGEILVIETTGVTGIEFSEKYNVDKETGQLVQSLEVGDNRSDRVLKMTRYFNRKGR